MIILLILAIALIAFFGIGYAVLRATRGQWPLTRLAILIAVMVGVPYLAWTIFYPSSTPRAKLTVEIETPEGLKAGSSVQELTYKLEPCPMCNTSGPKFRRHVRGEAVVVDLGARGLFFLLLTGKDGQPSADPSTPDILIEALAAQAGLKEGSTAALVRGLATVSGKADIPRSLLPLAVRFRDINDPKSVERVDLDNLAGSFGPSVKLVRATIEIVPSGLWPLNFFGITGTPLTTGIEKRLVWLTPLILNGGALDGSKISRSNELSNRLGGGAFKW